MKPRIAFVVQRYGADIAGGSEQLCRLVAERLARHCSCDVITTCARDYMTWSNELPSGATTLNGVKVRRFPVDTPRDVESFNQLSGAVFGNGIDQSLEERWMKEQGPYSTALLSFLEQNRNQYDVFIFFTYLYCTTYYGLPLVSDRSILVPTAHDEAPIYLSIFDRLFQSAQRLLFLTPEEQEFVYRRFCLPDSAGEMAGLGLEVVPCNKADRPSDAVQRCLTASPYMLYVGRIDESKGCKTLMEWFERYHSEHPESDLNLVLAGKSVLRILSHSHILAPGYVSEAEKQALINGSLFTVAPSPYESLCISALESWLAGKPVLANGECSVLAGQCRRSNGGLWYRNYDEFAECVSVMASDERLRRVLGTQGQSYVSQEYTWARIEDIYMRNIYAVSGLPRAYTVNA